VRSSAWITGPLVPKPRPLVAVIDDDPDILDAIDSLLSAHDYDTELYASAEAFRKAAPKSEAVCLIVDVQLGDSCGIELVRQLADSGLKFPIIYMTGRDNERAKSKAEETGCVAFLLKPFRVAVLIEALTKAIG
jgi:FixJ family two-component response regulator